MKKSGKLIWLSCAIIVLLGSLFVNLWSSQKDGGLAATATTEKGTANFGAETMSHGEDKTDLRKMKFSAEESAHLLAFKQWLNEYKATAQSPSQRGALAAAGAGLAQKRHGLMLKMIKETPQLALEEAVSFADYAALPAAVKPFVEEPFSERADWQVARQLAPRLEQKAVPTGNKTQLVTREGGKVRTWEVTPFGRRLSMTTKEQGAVQGVRLGSAAAVRDAVFQQLDERDVAAVEQQFLVANQDKTKSFGSDLTVGEKAVVAAAGGRLFYFANAEALQRAEQTVAEAEKLPGPHTGSPQLMKAVSGATPAGEAGAVQWSSFALQAKLLASVWTESPKSVLCIVVDFTDSEEGAPTTPDNLAAVFNGPVRNQIEDMSYDKTTINATAASVAVVHLDNTQAFYLNAGAFQLHVDAVAGATAAGVATGGYDITTVALENAGFPWVGLAEVGGSRQWLQKYDSSPRNDGSTSPLVITHELGHNYGLSHANFWATSDGSVVGEGENQEYGDIYDLMGDGPFPQAHFHAQGKNQLNWLTAADVENVTASGVYRVRPMDDPVVTTGIRALKIPKAIGEYYWVNHRTLFDDNTSLEYGLNLNWEKDAGASYLLDTTPNSAAGKNDAGLLIGKTYADPVAGVYITPLEQGGTGTGKYMDVQVNIGAFTGNTAPAINAWTDTLATTARTATSISVDATDAEGDNLAYAWDFGDGTFGGNTPVISHSWTVGGTYTVTVTITDMRGGTTELSSTVTVTDPATNWTQRTSNTTAPLYGITASPTTLLAVGGNNGTCLTSVNGVTWTASTRGINRTLDDAVWTGSQFIVVGSDYDFAAPAAFKGEIETSPDAVNWTRQFFSGAELNGVASNGTTHVAVGNNGTILYSSDAIAWNTANVSNTTVTWEKASFGNGYFVVVGKANAMPYQRIMRSTDGNQWEDVSTGSGVAEWQYFTAVSWVNDRFVASGFYTGIRHSTDGGLTWDVESQSDIYNMKGIAYGREVYLTVGTNPDTGVDVDALSTDGMNWQGRDLTPRSDRQDAIYFNNTFITVGINGTIYQSDALQDVTYAITSIAGENGNIQASASGASSGGSVSFTATPDNEYLVDQWLVDGVPMQTGGTTFVLDNIFSNQTVQVSFAVDPAFRRYTVTPQAGLNGTINPSTTQSVLNGTSVTFTATPNDGYTVEVWLVNGVARQGGSNTFVLNNVSSNTTVKVTFIPNGVLRNYSISPIESPNGTITANRPQTVTRGGTVTFLASPDEGYVVDQWLVNGVVAQTGGFSFTFANVSFDQTIQVTFAVDSGVPQNFTITPLAGPNGSINPGTPQSVSSNASVTFTAAPNNGYIVDKWLVNGAIAQTGGRIFTLNNVTSSQTVQVTFAISTVATQEYSVTPLAGINGTISPNTTQIVVNGGSATFNAVPDNGYIVDQWLVNGAFAQSGGNVFTLVNVTADQSVQATFLVQPDSAISLSGNLAFGFVEVTTSATRNLVISNPSATSLVITGITYPSGFSGENFNGTLVAGSSQTIAVTFLPAVYGEYTGNIIVSSDADSGTNIIAVAGAGGLPHSDIFGTLVPDVPDGWVTSPWFGRFDQRNFPTTNHERMGVIIYHHSQDGGLWFFHPKIKWIWAAPQNNGWVYALTPRKGIRSSYIYFLNPKKFYSYAKKKTFKIQ